MKLTLGVISMAMGLMNFAAMAFISWKIYLLLGMGDVSPVAVGGAASFILLGLCVLMIPLSLFFGLFRFKRRSSTGRLLSIIGVLSSLAAILLVFVPFLLH